VAGHIGVSSFSNGTDISNNFLSYIFYLPFDLLGLLLATSEIELKLCWECNLFLCLDYDGFPDINLRIASKGK
jgi:hypothetical protein